MVKRNIKIVKRGKPREGEEIHVQVTFEQLYKIFFKNILSHILKYFVYGKGG